MMNRISQTIIFVLLLLAADASAQEIPRASIAKIDRSIATFMKKNDVPGLSVGVVVNGEPAWAKGYGFANLENDVRATAVTRYRTASIGKTMTATAAMQLVEQGKLDLDAEIQQYCPAFPRKQEKITSRMLLSHLSGIRHYGGPYDLEEQSSTVHYTNVIDALAPFKDDPLMFTPGTQFLYSTYGYNVLGCVIQGAAHQPYLFYMHDHVWGKAGMIDTVEDDPSVIVKNRSAGYITIDGKLHVAKWIDMSSKMPAGGFLTTVGDLSKFAAALINSRLIRSETFQTMITPAHLSGGEKIPFGMGWSLELEEWHGDTWVSHGGSTPGIAGVLSLMPRHKFAVAILTNQENLPGEARNDLSAEIAKIVLNFK